MRRNDGWYFLYRIRITDSARLPIPFLLVICIAAQSGELHHFFVGQRPSEVSAVLLDQRLCGRFLFYVKGDAALLSDLFSVSPCGFNAFRGSLVEIIHFLLRLLECKTDLFGCRLFQIAVDSHQNIVDVVACHRNSI